ncbi:hypothetical protein [Ekhidna sp.]|uniref:hypothetical protein n=1 Tax=Ekhidna sp. TaxID=2608089 RepID=UPI003B504A56
MNKLIFIGVLVCLISACGGAIEKQNQDADQETEAVEAITSDLEASKKELKSITDESLYEIDSLLENIE